MKTSITIKLQARILRQRLEGRVPADLLKALTDEELVEQYETHHRSKLANLMSTQEATA